MKILTLNFLTCAVKACRSSSASFPLHPKNAELVRDSIELKPKFLVNILPRIDWNALVVTSSEVRHLSPALLLMVSLPHPLSLLTIYFLVGQLGFPALQATPPSPEMLEADEKMLKELHGLLLETQIMEGKLVCGNCGHEYAVKEGIANFLLPNHLV
jgi:multifunctional methyltransferase subunit TRM112